MADELERLQAWYHSQCDGDWEHSYGISIENLDNPGWSVKVQLADTCLKERTFSPVDVKRSDTDWIHCKVERLVFHGHGGAHNLTELLDVFLTWADTQRDV